jgi:hypothetical protein
MAKKSGQPLMMSWVENDVKAKRKKRKTAAKRLHKRKK